MMTLNSIDGLTNSWENKYINNSQIDKRLVSQLKEYNLELKQADKDH